MKKTRLFFSLLLLVVSGAYAQVGLGTTNPQGIFHVDGAKDNAATGTPTTAQQANDLTVLSSGFVGIGKNTPISTLDISSTLGTITNTRYTSTANVGANFVLQKSSSNTNLTNGALANGDLIGRIQFKGNHGAGFATPTNAEINGLQVGASTTSNAGGKLEFATSKNGTVSGSQVRMTITDSGKVGIGTGTPTNTLEVQTGEQWGGIQVTNTGAISTGAAQLVLRGSRKWAWQSNSAGNGNGDGFFQLVDNDSANAVRLSVNTVGNVGIGTIIPDPSALLDVSSTTKSFLPPRVTKTQRDAIATPATGLVVYCTDCNAGSGCLQTNDGTTLSPSWSCLGAATTPQSSVSAVCNGFVTGTYSNNSAIAGTYTVTITNNSFSTITVPVASTNLVLSGVTASPALAVGTPTASPNAVVSGSVTIAGGTSSTITYPITGTPTTTGTLTGSWTIQTLTCSATKTVSSITIPTSITLGQNKAYIVASVFDQDYLPYTAPSVAATSSAQAADGTNEATTVNVQGTITTAGISVKIPVTATASGTLPAYSKTVTVPASLTEDGTSRDLTFSWSSQAYTTATTSINATIVAVGGTLNAKKLDINTGIGNDVLGILLASFDYPYNNAGSTTTYSVRDIAGVPDKMFGLPDNNSNSTTHMMLYLPALAEDGNIWLNNNLGAHYANINHANFNPAQQATSATDHKAYGSLFQWGRKGDGHELITFTNGTTGTVVNSSTTTANNSPTDALFIKGSATLYDWRSSQLDTLWSTEASANNPCPSGFRLPTLTEQNSLITAAGFTTTTTAASSLLKITAAGNRNYASGLLDSVGSNGYYWTGSVNAADASYRLITSSTTVSSSAPRANGFPVRCIKN